MFSRAYKAGALLPGGIWCDTDQDTFADSCRVPMQPGQWNTWVVYRRNEDLPGNGSKADIADELRTLLKGWERIETADVTGSVTILPPRYLNRLQIFVGDASEVENRPEIANIVDCSIQPKFEPATKPPIPIVVKFIWDDSRDSMPWFSMKDTFLVGWSYCDSDATYILARTYGITSTDAPPKVNRPFGIPSLPGLPRPGEIELPEFNITGGLEQAGKSITSGIFWGIVGAMGITAVISGMKRG